MPGVIRSWLEPSPAKVNLALAVCGKRGDGYHELESLVCRTEFGDRLEVSIAGDSADDLFSCNDPAVPVDDSNLVLQGLRLYRDYSGWKEALQIRLHKRIPAGAGLGGGSSNGVAVLRALQRLAPRPLAADVLAELAARLGSDCPLFLEPGPCLMRGRGEICEPIPATLRSRLCGLPLRLLRPEVAIPTAEAYQRLAQSGNYRSGFCGRSWLEEKERSTADLGSLLWGNDFESILPGWIPSIDIVLWQLRRLPGCIAGLSGSGSALFAIGAEASGDALESILRDAWGSAYWTVETRLE